MGRHGISANFLRTWERVDFDLVMSGAGTDNNTTTRGHGIVSASPGNVHFGTDTDVSISISTPVSTAGTAAAQNNVATGMLGMTAITTGTLIVEDG